MPAILINPRLFLYPEILTGREFQGHAPLLLRFSSLQAYLKGELGENPSEVFPGKVLTFWEEFLDSELSLKTEEIFSKKGASLIIGFMLEKEGPRAHAS